MTDQRPPNCQFRLQDEGKPYPRSACTSCGATIATGLGTSCKAGWPLPYPYWRCGECNCLSYARIDGSRDIRCVNCKKVHSPPQPVGWTWERISKLLYDEAKRRKVSHLGIGETATIIWNAMQSTTPPSLPEGAREALPEYDPREEDRKDQRHFAETLQRRDATPSSSSAGLIEAADIVRDEFVNKDINLAIHEFYRAGYGACAVEIEDELRARAADRSAT